MYYKIKVQEFLEDKPITEYEMLSSLEDKLTREEIKELLKEKNENDEFEITIKNAYGERKKDLLQIIPLSFLKKQGINPIPGYVLRIGEIEGLIKSVSGGRVIVDFNHPLAGKDIKFKIKIIKKFENPVDFVKELMDNLVKKGLLKEEDYKIEGDKIMVKERLKESIEEMLKVYNLNVKVEVLPEDKVQSNNNNSNK